jgi:F0F1-type ATP synthase membrane subunit c/vacuolar-type H+-ATPase subunit K
MDRMSAVGKAAWAGRLAAQEKFVAGMQKLPEYARMGQGAMGYAGIGVGIGVGALATRGFQGTTEAARLDREYELLGREVAGVFKPLVDGMANLFRDMRLWMRSLNEGEQNQLLQGSGTAIGAYLGSTYGPAGAAVGAGIGYGITFSTIAERDAAKRMRSVLSSRSRDDFKNRIAQIQSETAYTGMDSLPFIGLNERNRKDALSRMASSTLATGMFSGITKVDELKQERERLKLEATPQPSLLRTLTDPFNPFSPIRKINEFSQTMGRRSAIDDAYQKRLDELNAGNGGISLRASSRLTSVG